MFADYTLAIPGAGISLGQLDLEIPYLTADIPEYDHSMSY